MLVTINTSFSEGTATSADYSNTDTSVTFSGGSSNTQCQVLSIVEDELLENDEVFTITLSSTDSAVYFGNATTIVTIQDSTQLLVGFVNTTGSVTEGGSYSACVSIFSGQLSNEVALTLNVQAASGQGMCLHTHIEELAHHLLQKSRYEQICS